MEKETIKQPVDPKVMTKKIAKDFFIGYHPAEKSFTFKLNENHITLAEDIMFSLIRTHMFLLTRKINLCNLLNEKPQEVNVVQKELKEPKKKKKKKKKKKDNGETGVHSSAG